MVQRETWSKIGITLFLFFIIVGFTVPAFLNTNSTPVAAVEPKLCQTDADCYLTCDKPVAVLCTQNLCQQNSCEEYSYYPLAQQPTTFQLEMIMNGKEVNLAARSEPQNFFVTFTENEVKLFAPGLTLVQVLDKVNIHVNEQCLYLDSVSYCNNAKAELKSVVNGEQIYDYSYVPKERDNIKILYSSS